jgi:hypothetical protein
VAKKSSGRRKKHVPQRTCVGCRQVLEKRGLMRVVRTPDGVFPDPSGKAPGRGAYLHDQRACWQAALEKGHLGRALKVELTNEDRVRLTAIMHSLPEETASETTSM